MSTPETQLADFYASRDAEVRAIVAEVRAVLEWAASFTEEMRSVNAAVAECLEESRCILEDANSDLADLQTENGELRRAVEDSAACCRQLREMAEMALALAASKGSRAAGRILATFKAAYATAQETPR